MLDRQVRANSDLAAAHAAASVFARHLVSTEEKLQSAEVESIERELQKEAISSLNSHRALTLDVRIASSLEKSDDEISLTQENLLALVRLCGT